MKKNIQNINKVLWDLFIEEKFLENATLREIQEKLASINDDILFMWEYFGQDDDDDRSGFETYGFENLESIKRNFKYISDRWKCRFRTKWLLDLINLDYSQKDTK